MEVEQPSSEGTSSASLLESDQQGKELTEDEQFNFEKTIEVENSYLKTTGESNSPQENSSENGKKKAKEEKPPSKIVVRRLPPTMTKDQFLEQVSPLPEIDYMYYVQGNVNDNINPYSRAYLNFVNQEDLFLFSNTFDNYVFLDAKGQEYPAVVEFNMVQRFPKQRIKKKDPLVGTIESDPAWITFQENLLAEALENSKTQSGKATKQHYFETEISTAEEVNTTPLLEYLKVRRAEKARIREERREEKKRKELERKLKQKTKDKKEFEEEEPPKDVKVLAPKDRRDLKERGERGSKKKDEKDKVKEPRMREFKSRGGKSYQEERLKLAERREEKKRELLNSSEKKTESSEANDVSETTNSGENIKAVEEKPLKIEKKERRFERKGRYENDEWKEEKKRIRNEKNSKREGRDRKDDYSRRNSEKRSSDLDLRRKGKPFKNSDPSRFDKRKAREQEDSESKSLFSAQETSKEEEVAPRKFRSCDDLNLILNNEGNKSESPKDLSDVPTEKKRCNSLESKRSDKTTTGITEVEKMILQKKQKSHSKDLKSDNSSYRSRKDRSKNTEAKQTLKIKDHADEKKSEVSDKTKGSEAAGDPDNKKPSEAPPRTDRRIRNKDRPSLEIYRPGMGKFSKQRLEKEKTLGSSTEVESPSHSPSPTPKSKLIS